MIADLTLSARHGFHKLTPNSDAGRAFVAEIAAAHSWDIGTDYARQNILLDSFFANAGDWCRLYVLPRGLSLQWGAEIFSGESGIAALWEQCA